MVDSKSKQRPPKAIAVISGDIHYSLSNLALADSSTRMAIAKANELNVPFIANGDTTDTKAVLRAECVNSMIETFKTAKVKPYVNIGNHCKIHVKSIEHALNFLRPYAHVIDTPKMITELHSYIIPYYDNSDELRAYLKTIPGKRQLIIHQGLETANMGDYTRDASALNHIDVAGHRVIASHYHARQTIPLPNGGKWDFIGSPYSVSYGEANDPEKGFQVLMDDGSLEFIPTNLRKHIVFECSPNELGTITENFVCKPGDLLWVKLKGTKEQLQDWPRLRVALATGLTDFRLDLIPTDTTTQSPVKSVSQTELLDTLIDSMTNTSQDRKERLKELWRKLS